jgi:hypothetical protein
MKVETEVAGLMSTSIQEILEVKCTEQTNMTTEWSASRPTVPWGKNPQYPLYRRLGGSRAGLDAETRGKSSARDQTPVITLY